MKAGHVHAWRMVSPHPFGREVRYECKSCTAKRSEPGRLLVPTSPDSRTEGES